MLIWAVLILGFCFFKGPREIGGSFLTVLVSVLHPKVLLLFALAGVYCAALILAENKLGLWHTTAIKETVYWFLGTGLALAGNATQATPNTGVWKQTVRRALRATILIEFAVNLYVFPLVVEFVLVFIVLAFIGMQVVAARPEDRRAHTEGDRRRADRGRGVPADLVRRTRDLRSPRLPLARER